MLGVCKLVSGVPVSQMLNDLRTSEERFCIMKTGGLCADVSRRGACKGRAGRRGRRAGQRLRIEAPRGWGRARGWWRGLRGSRRVWFARGGERGRGLWRTCLRASPGGVSLSATKAVSISQGSPHFYKSAKMSRVDVHSSYAWLRLWL